MVRTEVQNMTYQGKVFGGKVVLPPEANLPDGTEVRVEPIEPSRAGEPVLKKLLALAGIAQGLPEDLAQNHDYYLYGTPKRAEQWAQSLPTSPLL